MKAKFDIVNSNSSEYQLMLCDLANLYNCMSITNDAEEVVKWLVSGGLLWEGRRLLYYDTEGQLVEILIKDGKFAGFNILNKKQCLDNGIY